jgi:predicted  nucleic acid-binding Zn-ribbon protein
LTIQPASSIGYLIRSATLKDQLRLLLKLQAIDTRVLELKTTIGGLPKPLEADKLNLAKLERMLADEKAHLAETERWRNDQEGLIASEDEAIRKAKAKLQAAKGSKDYTAANREMDNKRRARSEREDEVIKVLEALEKAKSDLEAHASHVAKLRERVTAEEQRIGQQIAELEVEATRALDGRDQIVAQIDPPLLQRYEKVHKQRGNAIVAVRGGVCQGCHMSIPPQLANQLAARKDIQFCPRCNRIIYHENALTEGEDDAAPKESSGDGASA